MHTVTSAVGISSPQHASTVLCFIVQGHVVATSPAFAHRLPHVFCNPDDFEPERFVAPREEDKAAPFSFIGFGGGRHGCMGSNFAILQVPIIPPCIFCPGQACFLSLVP